MSELWSSYYRGVRRLMYVVDAANWSQVASATLLLMPLLAHPHMQKAQVSQHLVCWKVVLLIKFELVSQYSCVDTCRSALICFLNCFFY